MSDDRIPIEQVLDDMYSEYGGPVAWAARDYYKAHYATPEEAAEMDREERREFVFAVAFLAALFLSPFVLLLVRHFA